MKTLMNAGQVEVSINTGSQSYIWCAELIIFEHATTCIKNDALCLTKVDHSGDYGVLSCKCSPLSLNGRLKVYGYRTVLSAKVNIFGLLS